MNTLLDIKGLTISRILGHKKKDKRIKHPVIRPQYILFSDGETYIELEEQDYHSYHDCSSSAREIRVIRNKDFYNSLLDWDDLDDANFD